MSKVKGNLHDIKKSKLRRSLRRYESRKIKNKRIRMARGWQYRCQRGYYVFEEDDYPIWPHRINTNLKSYRKPAERTVRHTYSNELLNHGLYKKCYDIGWSYG